MPKFIFTQNKFNNGEISESLQTADDLAFYRNSCGYVENFTLEKEGRLSYREGSYYFAGVKDNNPCLLIPFIPNQINIYLLEFTDSYLRIYAAGNSTPITTITSPYKEADLDNIQYDQTNNIMYLCDDSKTLYKLQREDTATFTLNYVAMETSTSFPFTPPWLTENISAITIQASATTGNITLTASDDLFREDDLYRYVQIRNAGSGTYGYAIITQYNSATSVNATVKANYTTTAAVVTWSMSAIPTGLAFYQSRLFLGQDDSVWGSRIYDDDSVPRYEDFTLGTTDTFAFKFVSGLLRTPILWLIANDRTLLCGTSKGVFLLDSLDTTTALSPTSPPDIQRISSNGSKQNLPIQKDNILFYINKNARRLNNIYYNQASIGFEVGNNNILSENITYGGIKDLGLAELSNTIIYTKRGDGTLLSFNYDSAQELRGWGRIVTDGEIERFCVIPRVDDYDQLYICVKRIINESTVRYLEYFSDVVELPYRIEYFDDPDNEEAEDITFQDEVYERMKGYNYCDSALTYNGLQADESITPAATSGNDIVFTASGNIFSSTDVGREIWLKEGRSRAKIVTYNAQNKVECNIYENFEFTSTDPIAAGNWYLTTDTVTGADHLEGKTVVAIADGGYAGSYTVSSGTVIIDTQASVITIGLSYKGLVELLNIEGGSQNGSSKMKSKSISKLGLYFSNSIGCKAGSSLYDLEGLDFGASELMGYPIRPFTGLKTFPIQDTQETEKRIYLLQDIPQPCNIHFMTSLVNVNDND